METSLLVLARAVHIGSAMLLVALPFFLLVVARGVVTARRGGWDGALVRTLARWFWVALAAELVSGVVWFWVAAAQMTDDPWWSLPPGDDLRNVLEQTQFGRLWMERLLLGVLLTGVTLATPQKRKSVLAGGSGVLIFGLSTLVLVTIAWAGHATAGTHDRVLHLGADVAHLFIGALWPIGLIPMGLFLRHMQRQSDGRASDAEMNVVQRFSRISLAAVLTLAGTGVINAWLMVGTWYALVSTTYGRLLLAKVAVVAVMIALGAVNRVYLLPRAQEGKRSFRQLRGTVAVESLLALVVLIVVGIMGMTAPPS